MSAELAQDVRAVHDYIAEHGWHQGNFTDPEGEKVCILGAHHRADLKTGLSLISHLEEMIVARGDIEIRKQAVFRGKTQLKLAPNGQSIIPYFNDHVLKSQAECLEFLDKAAIAAEEKV